MTAGLAIGFPEPGLSCLESLGNLLYHAASTVARIRSGEVTPVPRTPTAPAERLSRSSEGIRLLRVLVVGSVPDEITSGIVRAVGSVEDAAIALAVEGPFDVVVVPSLVALTEIQPLTTHPVVVDRPETRSTLRARLRLAVAADAARRLGGET